MKKLWLRSKKSKFNLKSKILLGVVALAVMVGLGTAPRAASDKTSNNADELLFSQMSFFDPFTLRPVMPAVESDPGTGILIGLETRPPIRIPFRPALRDSFQPPLVRP